MRLAWLSKALLIAVCTVSIISCEKKIDDSTPKKTTTVAGKGGDNTLLITPVHDSVNVDSCMVYIKYNTDVTPVTFDDSAKCKMVSGKPVATFKELKQGQYFIWGKGWDLIRSQTVTGSVPYTITTMGTAVEVTLQTKKI